MRDAQAPWRSAFYSDFEYFHSSAIIAMKSWFTYFNYDDIFCTSGMANCSHCKEECLEARASRETSFYTVGRSRSSKPLPFARLERCDDEEVDPSDGLARLQEKDYVIMNSGNLDDFPPSLSGVGLQNPCRQGKASSRENARGVNGPYAAQHSATPASSMVFEEGSVGQEREPIQSNLKIDEEQRRREQQRILESVRHEQEQKARSEREQRIRRERSQSAEARKREREENGRQRHNLVAEQARQKIFNNIEGDWLIQFPVTEHDALDVDDLQEEDAAEKTEQENVKTLTLPVASIKNGVLTWAPRLNREGNFPINLQPGGLLSFADGESQILGTLECPPHSTDASQNDPLSNNYKLRWSNGDNWVKIHKS